uniref:Uncharacterized protein n=1 Tax=Arundo donax TaxID=35708 RepID=A0A0A9GDR9_ARUDO
MLITKNNNSYSVPLLCLDPGMGFGTENHWLSKFSIPLSSNKRASNNSEGASSPEIVCPASSFKLAGKHISIVAVIKSPGLYNSLSVCSFNVGDNCCLAAKSTFLSSNHPTLFKKENPCGSGSLSDISSDQQLQLKYPATEKMAYTGNELFSKECELHSAH